MGKEDEPKALQLLQETLLRELNPGGCLGEAQRFQQAALRAIEHTYGITIIKLPLCVYTLTPEQSVRICKDLNETNLDVLHSDNPHPQTTEVMQELGIIKPNWRYHHPFTTVVVTGTGPKQVGEWVHMQFGWMDEFNKSITHIIKEGRQPRVSDNYIFYDLDRRESDIPTILPYYRASAAYRLHVSDLAAELKYSSSGSFLLFSEGVPLSTPAPATG